MSKPFAIVNSSGRSNRRAPTLSVPVAGTVLLAGNICVLFTANDAHMRELKVCAPAGCIVSNTVAANEPALQQIASVMKGQVAPSTRLRFHGRSSSPSLRWGGSPSTFDNGGRQNPNQCTHHMPKRGADRSDRWCFPAGLHQASSLVPREEMCSCV